jgi:hypothetical protein
MVADDAPQNGIVNGIVLMHQNVPGCLNFAPVNRRVLSFELLAQVA